MRGVDRATFEILSESPLASLRYSGYARDRRNVYYFGVRLAGARPATFVLVGSPYAKDERTVYHRGQPVAGSDPASFEYFDGDYREYRGKLWDAKDSNM